MDDYWKKSFKTSINQYSPFERALAPAHAIRFKDTKNPYIIKRLKIILGAPPKVCAAYWRERCAPWMTYRNYAFRDNRSRKLWVLSRICNYRTLKENFNYKNFQPKAKKC